jgi:hypothetical protein
MKTFNINNDLIDEIEVSVGKTYIIIHATIDGTIVEKNKQLVGLLNLYHMESYLNELTENRQLTNDILSHIKSKI